MLGIFVEDKVRNISNIQELSCMDRDQAHACIGTFEYHISKHGITHQTSVPYNPQQNGVEKRANRTLMNMARSMMFSNNVKLMFWGDIVVCAAYLRNIIPSHAIEDKTPHELWFGHLPYLRNLKVFSSTCYALIPKE